jgi:hypothetical protein
VFLAVGSNGRTILDPRKEIKFKHLALQHNLLNEIKVEVPMLNNTTRHEDVWGLKAQLHVFITSGLDEGEWLISLHGRFTFDAHWEKKAGSSPERLDAAGKLKTSMSGIEPLSSS